MQGSAWNRFYSFLRLYHLNCEVFFSPCHMTSTHPICMSMSILYIYVSIFILLDSTDKIDSVQNLIINVMKDAKETSPGSQ